MCRRQHVSSIYLICPYRQSCRRDLQSKPGLHARPARCAHDPHAQAGTEKGESVRRPPLAGIRCFLLAERAPGTEQDDCDAGPGEDRIRARGLLTLYVHRAPAGMTGMRVAGGGGDHRKHDRRAAARIAGRYIEGARGECEPAGDAIAGACLDRCQGRSNPGDSAVLMAPSPSGCARKNDGSDISARVPAQFQSAPRARAPSACQAARCARHTRSSFQDGRQTDR